MTLRWVPGWNGLTEPEAVSYVAAVEAADGQDLEFGVARAINDFVVGCKNDGIWDAIKACCILAGARTTNGALVPLVGTAPTPYNFDLVGDTDYNRETGLKGNGSTKYLNSNRANNADPQNSHHLAVHVSNAATNLSIYIGGESGQRNSLYVTTANVVVALRNTAFSPDTGQTASSVGFIGASRANSTQVAWRVAGVSGTGNENSAAISAANIFVFARNNILASPSLTSVTNARLSFYSIGESLDLALLDTRVTRLMNLITYTQTAGLPDLATMDLDAAAYIGGGYRAGGTLS